MVAFTASAALSIAGSAGELHDAYKEGFADSDLVYANVLDIAANLIGLGAGVAGKLAMGAEAAALAESKGTGAAWTGFKAFAGKAGSMAYRPLMAANYMGNGLNAIMMSDVALGQLQELDKIEDGDERTGAAIIVRAVEEPIRQLAHNAGLEGSVVVSQVRSAKKGEGLNVDTGEVEDLFAAGIIDPTMVTRSALQNAASIAKNILMTEAVVAEPPEKQPAGAGAGMPDMGGMM
jgi:hypothetical protein